MIEATFDPRPFIARATWTFSKTTAHKPNWKHEYAPQAKHEGDDDFRRFADLIDREGYVARLRARGIAV